MLVAIGFTLICRRFLRRFPRLLSIGLLLALPAVPACAASGSSVDPDGNLLAARDAMRAGDGERLAQVAPALAGSVLAPYVDYWRLSLRVRAGDADDAAVRGFFARHPGTYLADRLRGDWMLALGGQQKYAAYDAEGRSLVWNRDEPQLRCYALLARYTLEEPARHDDTLREARRQLASTSEPGGDGCTALADRLIDDGVLTVWPRLQALIERNQATAARRAALRLSEPEQQHLRRLLEQPAAWLSAHDKRGAGVRAEIALLAIVHLARDDPERAAHYAEQWQPALSPEQRGAVWGRIGHVGFQKLLPDAADWYRRGGEQVGVGPDYVRPVEVIEAEVRAALRASAGPDWTMVQATIEHMPRELQREPIWIYWNARAALAAGRTDVAYELLQGIAGRPGYYGQLALEELGRPLQLAPRPPRPGEDEIEAMAGRPGFARALKLYQIGLRDEGNHEWGWELRAMNDAQLLAAAEYARRHGVLDRMISSSERTRALVDLDQRYPTPYRDLMAQVAEPLGMDQAWIYGLIRQESRFIEDAQSSSGALGLMQLLPKTAGYVARRIGVQGYTPARIVQADLNMRLGINYMKLVLDDQDGHPLLASAAYNAGPRRLREWRATLQQPLEGTIFAETIPITETREYVKKVMHNALMYGVLLDDRVGSLKGILGTISPKPVPTAELP